MLLAMGDFAVDMFVVADAAAPSATASGPSRARSIRRGMPEMGESVVRLSPAEVALRDVAALHIDLEDAEADIKRALAVLDAAELGDEDAQLAVGDAAEHFLAWYDPTELPFVVELL